ncbi:MAG TPA: cupin domain-containing protein [Gaiellaceae bacterium]|jgi:quercetin dioxygenase-like cupin family protein
MKSKRLIVVLVLAGAAAVLATVAVATPGKGSTSTIMSIGSLQADLAYNTGIAAEANGLSWNGRQYAADQLPEFLMRLRTAGVTNLGEWLNLHPVVSAKFGMAPVGLLHSPEVVVQQARFAPGAYSGWHVHPGYLTATVVSGQVVRYRSDCSSETFSAGQSFYETAANPFTVRNESTADAVVLVTFVVPGGTPTTGLRIDKPQPTTCAK